jgi:hypothetical protein
MPMSDMRDAVPAKEINVLKMYATMFAEGLPEIPVKVIKAAQRVDAWLKLLERDEQQEFEGTPFEPTALKTRTG